MLCMDVQSLELVFYLSQRVLQGGESGGNLDSETLPWRGVRRQIEK